MGGGWPQSIIENPIDYLVVKKKINNPQCSLQLWDKIQYVDGRNPAPPGM